MCAAWKRSRTARDSSKYTLQHTETHCNTLPPTATHCNTLQLNPREFISVYASWKRSRTARSTSNTTHCNTLQHKATNCHTLQHTATESMWIYWVTQCVILPSTLSLPRFRGMPSKYITCDVMYLLNRNWIYFDLLLRVCLKWRATEPVSLCTQVIQLVKPTRNISLACRGLRDSSWF